MKNQTPFVIQFSELDHFCQEVTAQRVDIVRVWTGQFSTGGNVTGRCWHTVIAQAIDNRQAAVLALCLLVGVYDELHGQPFGPTAERVAEVVRKHLEDAKGRVEHYILENTSAAIRPGSIYTGLNGNNIQKARWDGFNHIYAAIREVRGEN